jgi:hypothetical protein
MPLVISAICCGLSLPGTAVMWKFASLMVLRERPNYWMLHDSIDFGYPCGHVMNAVVVAGVCHYSADAWHRPRLQRAGMLLFWVLLIAGTGLARIYVNAHYFTDDLAGFLMGLTWILLALPVLQWAFPGCQDRGSADSGRPANEFAGRASGLSRMMQEQWRRRGLLAGGGRCRGQKGGVERRSGAAQGAQHRDEEEGAGTPSPTQPVLSCPDCSPCAGPHASRGAGHLPAR